MTLIEPAPLPPPYDRLPAEARLPALGLAALLMALILWLFTWQRLPSSEPAVPHSIAVMLNGGAAPQYEMEPDERPGPAGGSNRRGTGSIDPELLKLPSVAVVRTPPTHLPEPLAVDLPQATRLPEVALPALPTPLVVDKSLPVRLGGNGAFKGDGEGFGRGHGNGVGDGSGGGRRGEGALKLIKYVSIVHEGNPGDDPLQGRSVHVRLWIGPDGIPQEAEVLSGPARVHEEVRRAALEWRFEVPPHLRAQAPFEVTIDFRFKTVRSPR